MVWVTYQERPQQPLRKPEQVKERSGALVGPSPVDNARRPGNGVPFPIHLSDQGGNRRKMSYNILAYIHTCGWVWKEGGGRGVRGRDEQTTRNDPEGERIKHGRKGSKYRERHSTANTEQYGK